MAKRNTDGDSVKIKTGSVNVTSGGTAGIDNSTGKTVQMDKSIATPAGFLLFALKRLPLLIWPIGVVAILAMVALVSRWHVPPLALVLGGIAIFVGAFGLVIFAALVQPMPEGVKPPPVSQMTLWAFAILLICCGFLTGSSLFFDWPIPIRSQLVAKTATTALSAIQNMP